MMMKENQGRRDIQIRIIELRDFAHLLVGLASNARFNGHPDHAQGILDAAQEAYDRSDKYEYSLIEDEEFQNG